MQTESIQPGQGMRAEAGRDEDRRERDTPEAKEAKAKRFRSLLLETRQAAAAGREGGAAAEDDAAGEALRRLARGDAQASAGEHRGDMSAAMFVLQQAQAAAHHATTAPPAAGAAAGTMAPALADLIAKHVRMLLVPAEGVSATNREVMLTLGEDVLPGTRLWLARTESGWSLRADAQSADAYRFFAEHSQDLVQRFSERQLGTLEIEQTLVDASRKS